MTRRTETHLLGVPMRRPVQLVIVLTVFIDLLGFTVILPSLPFFAADLGATGILYGFTVTAYSVAQFLAAPLLGRLSDLYGRRPVLLLALAGSALSLALSGAATSLGWLIAARALAGAFGGSISVAQAYLADAVPEERRTAAMARLGMAIGTAFVAGPALGAVLAPWGFQASAYAAAALAAANLVAAWFLLPEPPGRLAAPGRTGPPGTGVLLLSGTGFLTMAAFVGMETTLAFLGRDRYGWGPEAIGLAMAAAGLSMAAVQAGPVTLLARRWGDARVAAAGAVVMAACLPVVPAGPAWLCVLAVCVLSAGNGLVTPTVASLLAAAGPPDRRGARLGAGQSASAFARIVGPAGAGVLFDAGVALPYVAGAGLAGLAAVTVLAARNTDALSVGQQDS
ncbi:MFS transporter [Nonomuraea harbinensis]|uniref:MFS transporter n=1 Tax=Nonomuraea harbinensis TaxID=1286938 RepID=A0ABW1BMX3_9ACTN